MRVLSIFVLTLLVPASSVLAGEPEVDCKNDSGSYVTSYCTGKTYEAADAKLNSTYKKLQSLLDAADKTTLKDNQRAWIKYRDATCDFETEPTVGTTGMSTYTNECLSRLTGSRTTDLEKAIEFRSP